MQHAIIEQKQCKSGNFSKMPNLILMDGGMIQVQAAESVLKELNIDIPVCGMIKDDKHRTKAIIFQQKEIVLRSNTEGFKLLTRFSHFTWSTDDMEYNSTKKHKSRVTISPYVSIQEEPSSGALFLFFIYTHSNCLLFLRLFGFSAAAFFTIQDFLLIRLMKERY